MVDVLKINFKYYICNIHDSKELRIEPEQRINKRYNRLPKEGWSVTIGIVRTIGRCERVNSLGGVATIYFQRTWYKNLTLNEYG